MAAVAPAVGGGEAAWLRVGCGGGSGVARHGPVLVSLRYYMHILSPAVAAAVGDDTWHSPRGPEPASCWSWSQTAAARSALAAPAPRAVAALRAYETASCACSSWTCRYVRGMWPSAAVAGHAGTTSGTVLSTGGGVLGGLRAAPVAAAVGGEVVASAGARAGPVATSRSGGVIVLVERGASGSSGICSGSSSRLPVALGLQLHRRRAPASSPCSGWTSHPAELKF